MATRIRIGWKARLLVGVFVSPFLLVGLAVWIPAKAIALLVYAVRLRRCFSDHLVCPLGHVNRAYGVWECARCHAVFHGWVFRRCPVCRAIPGFVTCETCGLAIKSPLVR